MHSRRRTAMTAALLLSLGATRLLPAQTVESPLGKWRGTSLCTPEGSPACKDEVVLYDFRPLTRDSVLLHADKIVHDSVVPMYDLGLHVRDGGWEGEFQNSRFHIIWRYEVRGDSMTGVLYLLPDRTIGRRVAVGRVR